MFHLYLILSFGIYTKLATCAYSIGLFRVVRENIEVAAQKHEFSPNADRSGRELCLSNFQLLRVRFSIQAVYSFFYLNCVTASYLFEAVYRAVSHIYPLIKHMCSDWLLLRSVIFIVLGRH